MAALNFQGLMAAAFTPMRADGGVDLGPIERQAERLAADGVNGAFVCGTTGEGVSLTVAERRQVAARWCDVTRGFGWGRNPFPVVVHVAHTSLPECRALAAHAQEVGAAGVALIAPFFYKPAGAADLAWFCAAVASAAPALPFYYYHFPEMTGVTVPAAEFLEHARGQIPNLAGLKFSGAVLSDFTQCLRAAEAERVAGRSAWDLLYGRDEVLLGALALGARAAVGGTFNFTGPIFRRLLDAFARGDLAAAGAEQALAARAVSAVRRFGGVNAMKAVMPMVGLDCGPPRPPLRALTASQVAELERGLGEAGFFEGRE